MNRHAMIVGLAHEVVRLVWVFVFGAIAAIAVVLECWPLSSFVRSLVALLN